jgi:hypothetical protein
LLNNLAKRVTKTDWKMAKQVGPVYYEGTIGDIVFYQMNGEYYARFKGNYKSLKQMKRLPKYKRVVENTKHFGHASSLASWIYQRHLPKELKSLRAWGQFTSKANRLRREGKTDKEVKEALIQLCEHLTLEAEAAQQATLLKPRTKKSEAGIIGTVNFGTSEPASKQARYLPSPIAKTPSAKPSLFAIPIPPMPNPQFQISPLSSS